MCWQKLLINPETYHRQHHVRGLIDILRRLNSQNQAYDETIQSIYYSHFFAEVRVSRPLGEQDDDIDDVDALVRGWKREKREREIKNGKKKKKRILYLLDYTY